MNADPLKPEDERVAATMQGWWVKASPERNSIKAASPFEQREKRIREDTAMMLVMEEQRKRRGRNWPGGG